MTFREPDLIETPNWQGSTCRSSWDSFSAQRDTALSEIDRKDASFWIEIVIAIEISAQIYPGRIFALMATSQEKRFARFAIG
jgi:hypothetical protein